MSVLAEETSLYPALLLEGSEQDDGWDSSDRRWWVLYTKSRQEKAVGRALLGREISFFLPLVKKTLVYRGKTVCSLVPLFAGYVFLWGSEYDRIEALSTNRISRVLAVHDPERLRDDLRQIHWLIESGAPLTVEQRLSKGRRVRVRGGLLAGLEGTVLARHRHTRLLVSVDFLQQGASVEIPDYLLEPID